MLSLVSMAMQQSPKGAASGSGPNPALTDDQADQFAADFTPSWDSDAGAGENAGAEANGSANPNATLVDMAPVTGAVTEDAFAKTAPHTPPTAAALAAAAAAAAPIPTTTAPLAAVPAAIVAPPPAAAAPVPFSGKQTLIGAVAPPAHAPPPAPAAAAAVATTAAPRQAAQVTQVMQSGQLRSQPASRHPAPGPGPRPAPPPNKSAPRAVSSDPFAADEDFVPKKSSKTAILVVAGLAVAAGLGLFLKFALTDDAPKTPTAPVAIGPAVATAEIPPPPPKVEAPSPPSVTAVAAPTPKPEPLPAATSLATAPQRLAAPVEPAPHRQPRVLTPPPPTPAVAAPQTPAAPKTPPKPPNGGIVRDNPF